MRENPYLDITVRGGGGYCEKKKTGRYARLHTCVLLMYISCVYKQNIAYHPQILPIMKFRGFLFVV